MTSQLPSPSYCLIGSPVQLARARRVVRKDEGSRGMVSTKLNKASARGRFWPRRYFNLKSFCSCRKNASPRATLRKRSFAMFMRRGLWYFVSRFGRSGIGLLWSVFLKRVVN
ncbi:hypothetical protein GWI33_009633 [Rhynchophorus ferrugineus]|uniref:Uncharacterized protein n=1 Tax=Rhynchophorus ferrugineus TaxID=354439 RepID=A0A834I6T5_RHYFE|nr:hypothetical protein GWI33_013590 [Rhynchophorus ferrugineus]KAF7276939.1 hypothetical protein GWI33_009633 [Rhynchophorus ferrugineus]